MVSFSGRRMGSGDFAGQSVFWRRHMRIAWFSAWFMVLPAVLSLLAGCGSDETVNNYYQTPQLVQIRTSYLPPAVVSQAYSVTLAAAGGGGTYAWSIETGGINDAWLTIGATTGVLSGTPAAEGGFVVIIRCADSGNAANFDIVRYEQFSHTVLIKTSFVPDAVLGASYSVALEAAGGSGSYDWTIETGGENDSWLTLNQSTGVLSGTPLTLMDVVVNVRVEDTASADFDTAQIEFSVVHAVFPGSTVEENNHDGDCFKAGVMPAPMNQAPGIMTFSNHADGTAICFAKARELMPGLHNAVDLTFLATGWIDGEPVVDLWNGARGFVRSGGGTNTIEVEIESGTFFNTDTVVGRLSGTSDSIQSTVPSINQYPIYRYSIWASYFNGSAFTPWVEVRGPYDTSYSGQCMAMYSLRVAYLNTQGNSAAQGGNRVGDAVILFSSIENDAVADVRLFGSYFDATHAAVPVLASNPSVKYGFNTEAYAINNNSDTTDVKAVGFMTDGLYMMTPEFGESFDFFMNGNHVTFLGAVWTEESRVPNLEGFLFSANFDLSDSNTANEFSAPAQFTPATTMDSDDRFESKLVVTGDVIFYQVMLEYEAGMLNHRILEAADWDKTNGVLRHATRLTRTDPTTTVYGNIDELHAFGSAYGLSKTYAVGFEEGYDEGGYNIDADVMLYIFDPATGAAQVAEIDRNTTNANDCEAYNLIADVNRTSEVIFVGWMQYFDSANQSDCFFMQAVQTTGAGRTLANSILASPLRMNNDYQSASSYADVRNFSFSGDMMGVLTFTSDYLRLNTIFLQEPDTADSDNVSLHTSYIKVTLGGTVSTPPTATGGPTGDKTIWTNDTDDSVWSSLDMRNFACLDSGTNGEPIVYFIGDGDGTPLDEDPGDPSESRLFVWDGRMTTPVAVEISGDCTDCGISTFGFSNSRQVRAFRVQPTAFSAYTGAGTENNPPDYHHVIIIEERDMPGSWAALRHRCFDLNSTAPQIQQKFFPALTQQPFTIDCDSPAESRMLNLWLQGPPLNLRDNTLGVYFLQDGHIYYNEYTPGAATTWYLENGATAPRMVDDESDGDVVWSAVYLVPPFEIGTWDILSGSAVFYVKTIGSEDMLFVRVRD